MNRTRIAVFVFLILYTMGSGLWAEPVRDQYVEAELISEYTSLQPGHVFTVALKLKHDESWHTYWKNPGDAGLPTEINWELPDGFSAGAIQWPTPHQLPFQGGINYGYEGTVLLLVDIAAPENLIGDEVRIAARVNWLMCEEVCIPGEADLSLLLPVNKSSPVIDVREKENFTRTRQRLPRELPAWKVNAYLEAGQVSLSIAPDTAVQKNITAVYFYSEDAQIDANASQLLRQTDDGYRLTLTRASYAEEISLTLPGVLYSQDGWLADDDVTAMRIAPKLIPGEPPLSGVAVTSDLSKSGISSFFAIIGLAFIGGLILNFMPCVFPILGLKVMGFVKQAGEDRRKVTLHGLIFTLGVLVSFWILTGILIALRAGGEELGWGFQLQSPAFVFALTVVLFIFALNLSGLFEVGVSAINIGSKLTAMSGTAGSFFTGVLATIVATPCAAPFLAPALSAALTLSAFESLIVFTSIALGLSLPYLLLSVFPEMVKLLPRPGAWMESFKQLLAFPLYATTGYLLWVLGGQIDEFHFLCAIFGLVFIAMATWVYGRWSTPARRSAVRHWSRVGTIALFTLGLYIGYPLEKTSRIIWESWSPEKVIALQAEGHPVYVDFTARWCATCQTNKATVFSSDAVVNRMREKDVVALKADWTLFDPLITNALASYGRSAVPFNIIYTPKQSEPIILPELLTPGIVLDALDKL